MNMNDLVKYIENDILECRPEKCTKSLAIRELPTEIADRFRDISHKTTAIRKELDILIEQRNELTKKAKFYKEINEEIWKDVHKIFPDLLNFDRLFLSKDEMSVLGANCLSNCLFERINKIVDPTDS